MPTEVLEKNDVRLNAAAGKYLTFLLGGESYGVPVLKIREIIRLVPITPVPQMPDHLRGVINLRGKIIPIVDLHVKFGLASRAEGSERVCIVVVQVKTRPGTEIQLGLLVDNVEEVAQIAQAEIENAPEFGGSINTHYILGIAKLKNRVAILLDIDRVLAEEELAVASKSAAQT